MAQSFRHIRVTTSEGDLIVASTTDELAVATAKAARKGQAVLIDCAYSHKLIAMIGGEFPFAMVFDLFDLLAFETRTGDSTSTEPLE